VIEKWSFWEYKGNRYFVTGIMRGAGSLNGADFVRYQPLYECEYSEFVRPLAEFEEKFTRAS
jgi:hypothetical protein